MTKNVRGNFKHVYPFGYPVYILDENLQSGKNLPKWNPRDRVGIYLDQYREHASNVEYVLNPRTYHISPQYHVIYDDDFVTVLSLTKLQEVNIWESLNKTKSKLGLVNQLPNQDKFDFKEQSPKLNVVDLLDIDSRSLVRPGPLERHLDNPRSQKNRKTKNSYPLPRVTKDCNLKDKNSVAVDTYGVCDLLAPVPETVSTSRLLRKRKFKQTIESEGDDEKLHLEEVGGLMLSKRETEVADHGNTDAETDLSNIVKQNIVTSKRRELVSRVLYDVTKSTVKTHID